MQILAQELLKSYPEFSIIPTSILYDSTLFHYTIRQWQKELIRSGDEQVLKKLQELIVEWELNHQDLNIAFVIICVKQPHMTNEQLIKLNQITKLSDAELLLNAYKLNHANLIEIIEAKLQANQTFQSIIRQGVNQPHELFKAAFGFNHPNLVNKLFELIPDHEHHQMIHANANHAFITACANGSTCTIELIFNRFPDKIDSMLKRTSGIEAAIEREQVETLQYFFKIRPMFLKGLIEFAEHSVIKDVVAYRRARVLQLFCELFPDILVGISSDNLYELLERALIHNQLQIVKCLHDTHPQRILSTLISNQAKIFGHLFKANVSGFKYLFDKLPKSVQLKLVQERHYNVCHQLCKEGDLAFFKQIAESFPTHMPRMMQVRNYSPFIDAICNAQFDLVKYLFTVPGIDFNAMLMAQGCKGGLAFARAYLGEKFLLEIMARFPESMTDIFLNNSTQMLQHYSDVMITVKFYLRHFPDDYLDIIKAGNFKAFMMASLDYNPKAMQFVLESAPQLTTQMLMANEFQALKNSAGRAECFNYLMQFEIVQQFVLIHPRMFQMLENNYIAESLRTLRERRDSFLIDHPQAEFELSDTENQMLYYMLRELIKNRPPSLLSDLELLISIQGFADRIHLNAYGEATNELFNIAMQSGNRPVVEMLWQLFNVSETQIQNHPNQFFQRPQPIDTEYQDRESAMRSLSTEEQKRYETAIETYQPQLETQGEEASFAKLQTTLEDLYQNNPVTFDISPDNTCTLPLHFQDFEKLGLTPAQKNNALKQYYSNPIHTAWRLLQKPNPWIHQKAQFVEHDARNPHLKWAPIEKYRSLMSMLFLAASDASSAPIDDYTLETRQEHFFNNLALINRAHNWDKRRFKIDSQGQRKLDASHQPVLEHYDDLGPDRPSCIGGIKRRLLNSIAGHVLFRTLTSDIIKQEIDDFYKAYIKSVLNPHNAHELNTAWINYIINIDEDALKTLKQLDLPETKHQELLELLTQKYSSQFTKASPFYQQVQVAFLHKRELDAHILNFPNINLAFLLEEHLETRPYKKARF